EITPIMELLGVPLAGAPPIVQEIIHNRQDCRWAGEPTLLECFITIATFHRWSFRGAARHIVHRPPGDRSARRGDLLSGHGAILCAIIPRRRAARCLCPGPTLDRRPRARSAAAGRAPNHGLHHTSRRPAARLARLESVRRFLCLVKPAAR